MSLFIEKARRYIVVDIVSAKIDLADNKITVLPSQ